MAVTLELWADPENDAERSCCSASAVAQARSLAHAMGLAHFTLDLREQFRAGVVEPFIAGYAEGETPNPCVGCNGHVRLDAMLALADRLGAARLATGHYARLAESDDERGPLLRAAVDPAKDQTYMLAALAPASLARMHFPLGELRKPEVRAIAARAGLPVAGKPDSQDLCFLAGTDRARFLARHGGIADQPGELVDGAGTVLGRHRRSAPVHRRPAPGARPHRPRAALRARQGRRSAVGSRSGPRPQLRRAEVPIRSARLHRPGARVDRVKLRYRQTPIAARVAGAPAEGRHRRLRAGARRARSTAPPRASSPA